MSKTALKNKSFSVVSLTALLLLMSSLSVSVKQEPDVLQSEYSVGIGQAAMALNASSWQYKQLVSDAGVMVGWVEERNPTLSILSTTPKLQNNKPRRHEESEDQRYFG